MGFLEKILAADRPRRTGTALYGEGRHSVGDGIEAADVAFYGPMVLVRPVASRTEES